MPKRCMHKFPSGCRCNAKLKRSRRTSWSRGYVYCPYGHDDWYGKGRKVRIVKRVDDNENIEIGKQKAYRKKG